MPVISEYLLERKSGRGVGAAYRHVVTGAGALERYQDKTEVKTG